MIVPRGDRAVRVEVVDHRQAVRQPINHDYDQWFFSIGWQGSACASCWPQAGSATSANLAPTPSTTRPATVAKIVIVKRPASPGATSNAMSFLGPANARPMREDPAATYARSTTSTWPRRTRWDATRVTVILAARTVLRRVLTGTGDSARVCLSGLGAVAMTARKVGFSYTFESQ